MDKDEIIAEMAKLLAGLQVPVSMGMPLGAALEPWQRLYRNFNSFGWTDAEVLETELKKALEA